eukprot:1178060-Prorocentrum_minimum.AAC.6
MRDLRDARSSGRIEGSHRRPAGVSDVQGGASEDATEGHILGHPTNVTGLERGILRKYWNFGTIPPPEESDLRFDTEIVRGYGISYEDTGIGGSVRIK